jgi:pyridoxal phosphate enzyme (YggS family)
VTIRENVEKILKELPEGVTLLAAAKTRLPEELREAIDVGVEVIGQNYVQEAERAFRVIGRRVKWHLIGPLQRNKVKKAVEIFDMIETVDSIRIAGEIDKKCQAINKIMPVLIEINSAREKQKAGVEPENAIGVVKKISNFCNLKIMGLMTMGPAFGSPEDARPYFVETKMIFDKIKLLSLPNIEMKYLSMGMTNSYRIAIEEGANIVRLGTLLFGARK